MDQENRYDLAHNHFNVSRHYVYRRAREYNKKTEQSNYESIRDLCKKQNREKPSAEMLTKWDISEISNNDIHVQEKTETVDVVWITAVQEERVEAARAIIRMGGSNDPNKRKKPEGFNLAYSVYEIDGVRIALTVQSHMGMTMAASLTTRAILGLKPRLVVMSGICGGREGKIQQGDILVAEQTFDYSAGKKQADEFKPRPVLYTLNEKISGIIKNQIDEKYSGNEIAEWWDGPVPVDLVNIYLKTMACSSAVIDDGKTLKDISLHQDDVYGVDMESYGVALAASALDAKWIVAKGVQDFGNGSKNSTENSYRQFAAFSSAVLIIDVIRNFF